MNKALSRDSVVPSPTGTAPQAICQHFSQQLSKVIYCTQLLTTVALRFPIEMTPQTSAYVDVNPIILTHQHKVILARRKRDLVEGGKWHLPGGRVLVDEDFKTALKRIAFGKTNLTIELYNTSLKESLVGIYDDPKRDPREHVIGLAFTCKILGGKLKPKQKVIEVKAFHRSELGKLEIAFDHQKMIEDAFVNLQKERKL